MKIQTEMDALAPGEEEEAASALRAMAAMAPILLLPKKGKPQADAPSSDVPVVAASPASAPSAASEGGFVAAFVCL